MSSNITRAVVLLALAVVTAAGFAVAAPAPAAVTGGDGSSLAQDGTNNETAAVRVVHVAPDAGPVDVFVDDEAVLRDVPFAAVSNYQTVSAGEHRISVSGAGERVDVGFEANVTLATGTAYTVAAIGEVSPGAGTNFEPLVLVDDAAPPEAGNASVRLVHAAPDAPAVDVTVPGIDGALFDNVTYANATDYVAVPAGNYTLEVRRATPNNDGEVVSTVNVTLAEGRAYTGYANGYLNPADAPGDRPFRVGFTVDPVASGPTIEVGTPAGNETGESDADDESADVRGAPVGT